MKGFIEVTENKRKYFLAVSEIKVITRNLKGYAVIFMKEYYRPLFRSIDGEIIICNETFEEVTELIEKAVQ